MTHLFQASPGSCRRRISLLIGLALLWALLAVSQAAVPSAITGDGTLGTTTGTGALTEDRPTLLAPSGRIQLASVASPGEVGFSRLELAPDLQVDGFARLGRMALSQAAFLDASGDGGGTVHLQAGHLTVDRARIFANNQGPRDGVGLGLDVRITADAVLTNGARLTTDSVGAGRARDLRLTAGRLSMDNTVIGSRPLTAEAGDGGNLGVNVGTLTLSGGAQIDSGTRGAGRGGELRVTADTLSIAGTDRQGVPSGLFSSAEPGSSGDAGSLAVRAGRLTLTDGAQIISGTYEAGRGGELRVTASEAIAIAGSGSGLFSDTEGGGAGGNLFVSAPLLQMDNGSIRAGTSGDGHAGNLEVRVGRLTLTGGAQIFNGVGTSEVVDGVYIYRGTGGPGRGGDLTVVASEAITIMGRDSGLFSNALFGPGSAGNLFLSAPLLTMDESSIQALTTRDSRGHAGNLEVQVGRLTLTGGQGSLQAPSAVGSEGM
jgi:large exoprotein involved in heme utilization and adhesion